MIGYPNVGKSSVINSILGVTKSSHGNFLSDIFLIEHPICVFVLGSIRVSVSSTPGRTKHFQTIDVGDDLTLCDCPGLVFPSFVSSSGELLCSGILPINQMKDYVEPASIIANQVPAHVLEATYGIHIEREIELKDNPQRAPAASEVLTAYCKVKGYITSGTGRWMNFELAKIF